MNKVYLLINKMYNLIIKYKLFIFLYYKEGYDNMDNNLNEAVLDKLTKTCTCKLITRAKIKEAIKNGASTLEEVQKATGAGSGPCKGNG
jgi:NAD(P)H-nitrite reductase large subunit